MFTLLKRISEVCTPPEEPLDVPAEKEWNANFRRIGTRLPEQMIQLSKLYGLGHFVSIQSPVNASFGFHFSTISAYSIGRLAELRLVKLKKPKAFPAKLYFEPGGLLPIGWMGSGIDVCFVVEGDNPDKWKVALLRATTNEIHQIEKSLIEFSIDVLEGKLESPLFSKHLPSTKGYRYQIAGESVKCWHAG